MKDKAIALRKQGYSLNEISQCLQVAKSSVSRWVSAIGLNAQAQERIRWLSNRAKCASGVRWTTYREQRKNAIAAQVNSLYDNWNLTPSGAQIYCALL